MKSEEVKFLSLCKQYRDNHLCRDFEITPEVLDTKKCLSRYLQYIKDDLEYTQEIYAYTLDDLNDLIEMMATHYKGYELIDIREDCDEIVIVATNYYILLDNIEKLLSYLNNDGKLSISLLEILLIDDNLKPISPIVLDKCNIITRIDKYIFTRI